MPWTDAHRSLFRAALASLPAGAAGEVAAGHGALALFWWISGACTAIGEDGVVLAIPDGKGAPVREDDPRIVRAALVKAAEVLGAPDLVPLRPPEAIPCWACGGAGRQPGVPKAFSCICFGSGWQLPGEPTSLPANPSRRVPLRLRLNEEQGRLFLGRIAPLESRFTLLQSLFIGGLSLPIGFAGVWSLWLHLTTSHLLVRQRAIGSCFAIAGLLFSLYALLRLITVTSLTRDGLRLTRLWRLSSTARALDTVAGVDLTVWKRAIFVAVRFKNGAPWTLRSEDPRKVTDASWFAGGLGF